MDEDHGSVSLWLGALKQGDMAAAQPLWDRYFERLIDIARGKLRMRRGGTAVADGEDAALSAFDSFFRGVRGGRYPQLGDRQDLWRLLVVITAGKACDQMERAGRKKRGGGWAASEHPVEMAVDPGPTPEFAAMVVEEFDRLLEVLDDDKLRQIALRKMEGHSSREIADLLSCSEHTVANKLRLIRKIWEADASGERPARRREDASASS